MVNSGDIRQELKSLHEDISEIKQQAENIVVPTKENLADLKMKIQNAGIKIENISNMAGI